MTNHARLNVPCQFIEKLSIVQQMLYLWQSRSHRVRRSSFATSQ